MEERRCRNCKRAGRQSFVTAEVRLSITQEGGTVDVTISPRKPLALTRGCFTRIQKWLYNPPTYVPHGKDDSCINPKRFIPREEPTI